MTAATPGPHAEYQRRIASWGERIAHGERRHLLISNLRLGTALIAAFAGWLVFVRGTASIWIFVVPLLVFLALAVAHALLLQRKERSVRARRLYERGLDRMDGRWVGSGPDGARFAADHSYARDLDLFGPGSLFQLLTTARTEAGEQTLAAWLQQGTGAEEIVARQQAVSELRDRLDFREDLAVMAAEAQVGRTTALGQWARTAPLGLPAIAGLLFAVSAAGTALTIALAFLDPALGWVLLVWLLGQMGLVAIWRRQIQEVTHRIEAPALDLRLLIVLLARVERESFTSPRLTAIRARLTARGGLPSTRLKRLQSFVSALDSLHHPLIVVIGILLLVRSQSAVAIDRWHAANGADLMAWLDALGELEALCSFAAFAYERPEHPFPVIAADGPVFDAVALAHPLIVDRVAVANDVQLGGDGPRVLLVSGSNMSGKSTLLRSVGCNVVLALAGAPVCARSLRLSLLSLGATLRVEDSLQAGLSKFYAEILRIRTIVESARGPRPLLFLLDEILHGTNSHDRRIGAEAIVRALVEAGAIGLVTTHDLALTSFGGALADKVANVHFEDRIDNGTMAFDYRMRPGVVEHSNALELMRAVGLQV